tara:strand:+ start:138 stop:470 length:333 start_codon:yes stop_codon:yes gene_type:complete
MLSITISDLDTITKINDYLNSLEINENVTTKMLIRNFKIAPKKAHSILKYRKDTMLCNPYEFGSLRNINYNLYKKIDKSTIESLTKKLNNSNESRLKSKLMNKYRINYVK